MERGPLKALILQAQLCEEAHNFSVIVAFPALLT
jgi:hypothetical protein